MTPRPRKPRQAKPAAGRAASRAEYDRLMLTFDEQQAWLNKHARKLTDWQSAARSGIHRGTALHHRQSAERKLATMRELIEHDGGDVGRFDAMLELATQQFNPVIGGWRKSVVVHPQPAGGPDNAMQKRLAEASRKFWAGQQYVKGAAGLAADLDLPESTIAKWLAHPEWPWPRRGKWSRFALPLFVQWAAVTFPPDSLGHAPCQRQELAALLGRQLRKQLDQGRAVRVRQNVVRKGGARIGLIGRIYAVFLGFLR